MHPKLNSIFRNLIVCPLCKTPLSWTEDVECTCASCGSRFFRSTEKIWNFSITYPPFLKPKELQTWRKAQLAFEVEADKLCQQDSYERYLAEIDSVSEIYTLEFSLSGKILDVGGGQGRLRHFLSSADLYLSVDPHATAFEKLDQQPNLLRAYPCLKEPCNFLQAHAEHLPLQTASFDFVHMRSVLDHFCDPYLALCEARRVLRHGGGIMIGVFVTGGVSAIREGGTARSLVSRIRKKVHDEGLKSAAGTAIKRLAGYASKDMHIWHPTYLELLDLVRFANFEIEKIHWQKPPFDHIVYLVARKK